MGKSKLRNRIIIVAISMILALTCTTMYRFWRYKETVNTLMVKELDLSTISDGEYEGEYDLSPVYAKVNVIIEGGKIEKISILEHKNGNGKKAEVIIEEVINQQKLGVNTITGATASSKALLKAIEIALKK